MIRRSDSVKPLFVGTLPRNVDTLPSVAYSAATDSVRRHRIRVVLRLDIYSVQDHPIFFFRGKSYS